MMSKATSNGVIQLSHPSVRIKGTENDFAPTNCVDRRCKHHSTVHMHCPFCIKSDIFFDERILKVHYGVKHVDKGIEFAGLKILRCCEHCDLVGMIKGEKKFKSAHWHCYKCRNGFNRRDEAVKHFRTHFRQPYSTFQIHIAQEVNNSKGYQECNSDDLDSVQDSIRDYVAKEACSSMVSRKTLGTPIILKASEDNIFVDALDDLSDLSKSSLVIENPNDSTEGQTKVMLIQEENMTGAERQTYLEKLVCQLQEQVLHISAKKAEMEIKWKNHFQCLKEIIRGQESELVELRKRQSENAPICSHPLPAANSKIDQLLTSMKEQHNKLLMEQLDQVNREVYHTLLQDSKCLMSCPMCGYRTTNNSVSNSTESHPTNQEQLTNTNKVDTIPSDKTTNYVSQMSLLQTDSVSVNSDCNAVTAFIVEKESSLCSTVMNTPYFVISQSSNDAPKRRFIEVQKENVPLLGYIAVKSTSGNS